MEFVEKVEPEDKNPLEGIAKSFANIIGEFVDEDTKNLVNKLAASDKDERNKLFAEYVEEYIEKCPEKMRSVPIYFQKNDSVDIDNLVKEKKIINSKIANLSEKDQIEFWAKYHDIPTETDLNNKLDTILDSIKTLNFNIIDNFNEKLDDIYTELSIIRKNMK